LKTEANNREIPVQLCFKDFSESTAFGSFIWAKHTTTVGTTMVFREPYVGNAENK
jgi:hypothetical protein